MNILPTKAHSGFTLVELVIVLVLIGILAVSVLPKILGRSSTNVVTTQDQIISVLRRMQTQAMQQTSAAFCHQLVLSQTQLGFPDVLPCDATTSNTRLTAAANQNSGLQFILPATSAITLMLFNTSAVTGGTSQTLPFLFSFNALGQPTTNAGVVLSTGLRIEIADVVTYRICIEPEGYIHPC